MKHDLLSFSFAMDDMDEKNSNICLSETAYQHKGTRKKCKKTSQAAIIQWQGQCLMYKPHRKP